MSCSFRNVQALAYKEMRITLHHQSDGMVERFNRILLRVLRSYVNDHHSDWDDHLPFVTAYRSVEHETKGYSPIYLMLPREVSTPLQLIYEMQSCMKSIPENRWG